MATHDATGGSLLSPIQGEPELDPFTGVDFNELERSLRRPRTLRPGESPPGTGCSNPATGRLSP